METTFLRKGFFNLSLAVIFIIFSTSVIFAKNSEIGQVGKTAVLLIPGIHHQYTGEPGLFRWSAIWKEKELGNMKVNSEFTWKNVLDQAELRGLDSYILLEKGKSSGKFVDGGILGHEVNEGMIINAYIELVSSGYTNIIIMGHSQAGVNIFGALRYLSEKDTGKMSHIQSIRLFDPAFASPLGSLATEPLVLPLAKMATGKVGTPLSPSEEDLTGRNGYLKKIRQSMPYMGKVFSQYEIPVYLMSAGSDIVSQDEIKKNAQLLEKNGCKVIYFDPKIGSLKFGKFTEGNKGYLYKKESSDPNHPKEQVPTESRMAHTPKLGSPENSIATNFFLHDIIIPYYFVSPSPDRPGKSINEAKTLTETVRNKHKAIIAGVGPEADFMYKEMVIKLGESNVKRIVSFPNNQALQNEAIKFGADIILGVRNSKGKDPLQTAESNKYHGVDMSPNPVTAGKGGSEVKQKVINSRPTKDSLSWEIK